MFCENVTKINVFESFSNHLDHILVFRLHLFLRAPQNRFFDSESSNFVKNRCSEPEFSPTSYSSWGRVMFCKIMQLYYTTLLLQVRSPISLTCSTICISYVAISIFQAINNCRTCCN